jgi:holliday junction resolvase YEN1
MRYISIISQVPFLPLFVFDGPLRPEMKRGKLIDMKPNWMVEGLKGMIEAFGFEWRTVSDYFEHSWGFSAR